MLTDNLDYKLIKPKPPLVDFVDFFWMLNNNSNEEQEVVVLPDGRIDLLFTVSSVEPYRVMLMGIGTEAETSAILPLSKIFGISFNLLAVEYILETTVSSFLSSINQLSDNFWGITENDLNDFEKFCQKVSEKMLSLLTKDVDERKRKLFQLIYSSNGTMPVKELSEKLFWTSRQINRYFNQQFELSLKTYCNILRFRASFPHLKEGKLYPEQNYSDQAHFIKEVKRFSGVVPKELSKNKDNRFVHFTTLPKK